MKKLRGGRLTPHDEEKFQEMAGKLYNAPIYIDDSGGLSPFDLRAKARRLKQKDPRLSLIVIDYLQLMHQKGKVESRQLEVAEISRALKQLAKELEVPIIALSQLNRKVEERKGGKPMLSDLRESGSIEQDADVVMFIHREDQDEGDGRRRGREAAHGHPRGADHRQAAQRPGRLNRSRLPRGVHALREPRPGRGPVIRTLVPKQGSGLPPWLVSRGAPAAPPVNLCHTQKGNLWLLTLARSPAATSPPRTAPRSTSRTGARRTDSPSSSLTAGPSAPTRGRTRCCSCRSRATAPSRMTAGAMAARPSRGMATTWTPMPTTWPS